MSERLKLIVETLEDLKLFDIDVFDFLDVSPYYDYQIICSASNERQAHSSIEFIKKVIYETDEFHVESDLHHRWVLLDLGDIIIHVMHQETRSDYQIEKLFFNRRKVNLEEIHHGV